MRLLPKVDVGALSSRVTRVFSPWIVLRLPTIQLLPAEVASHQVRLVFSSTAVEPCLGHLGGSAGGVSIRERPVLEGLESRIDMYHDPII